MSDDDERDKPPAGYDVYEDGSFPGTWHVGTCEMSSEEDAIAAAWIHRDTLERALLTELIDLAIECFGLRSGRPVDGLIAMMIAARDVDRAE